ncbi:hypothetical protein L3i20_v206120 [Paenibacillus sp. L3-i20]|nr:hypothetical protein L3i20_v206120 [Paenibacillus sp. L3-i20]
MADDLEEKGFIERIRDPNNSRANEIWQFHWFVTRGEIKSISI